MGAFILFPVLMFVLFIASVLGVTDYVHAETLVHAAAQTAVAAAAQDAMATTSSGDYITVGTNNLKVDGSSADSTIQSMLSNKPYITGWSCGEAGIDYSCLVHFSVSMPFVGHVNGSTSASASTFVVRQNANPIPSGPPNIPIFSGSTTTLEPGWALQQPTYNYAAGSVNSPAGDGGWSNVQTNGTASYTFSIPTGQSSTISYGIPINGYVNNSQTKIYVNDILQTTITADIGGGGGTASSQENLWSNTFQPGTYTIRIVSTGSINVYGLWASNLSYVTPQNPSPTQKITLSCTGQVANVSIPSGTTSIVASVSGAGGAGGHNDNTYGGAGGFVQAALPITSSQTSLDAIVGCGGQTDFGSGGGGGLSGIFTGTPSQSTALIIAGGGGGGANAFSTAPKANGSAGGFSPTLPFSPSGGTQGGAGYGGGGAGMATGTSGTAFGAGGNSSSASWCYYSGVGGYGGAGAGGCANGGGGGGGGFIGGQGGNTGGPGGTWGNGSGGQGGTSYTASSASNVKSTTGGGGQGGYGGGAGANGSITIQFFGKSGPA